MASQLFSNYYLCLVIFRQIVVQVKDIIMQSASSVPPKDQGEISHARETGNACVVKSFN